MTAEPAASIREEIRKELDEQFQRYFVTFSPVSLAWLALPPAWTEPLAEASGFPTDDLQLSQFLERASGVGFCVRRVLASPGSGDTFWMPDDARDQVIRQLQIDSSFGVQRLQEIANRIGRTILEARGRVSVPPVIARWAELAAHSDRVDETVIWLNERVTSLVESDDTGAASAWIDTGAALASSIGGALKNTVQLGTRRLELVYRKTQNERHLESFQERPEQVAAFLQLVEPDNAAWALHYLGMGGVGKTMLLRYVAARLAPAGSIPTSRIDFDHLSPDYPVRRPGQLLVELAADLRSYATSTDVERRFNLLRDRNDGLLEALSGEPPPHEPLANIRRPEFEQLLSAFTDLLVALPRPARTPIVLVLDTCEELARLPTRGNIQPGVEATFEILERVHGVVPDVRVILAGRRLLASSGPGWRVDDTKRSKTAAQFPGREFMRLHEIRGFDRGEALRFLTEAKKLVLSAEVLEAVVGRSRDVASVAPVIVDGAPQEHDPRCNPFDLSMYANWIREDPGVVVDQILSGETDPYIEMRIVYRLRDTPVEALLPSIVLWQRFDKAMLACAVPKLDTAGVDDLFGRIADLEWIDTQQDQELKTEYLEVDHNLYPRLLAYFREPPRDRALEEAARRLAGPLTSLVKARLDQDRSVHGLTFEHLNAALALSPPADGAALWNDVMSRIAEGADWSWALNVTSRLLGEARTADAPTTADDIRAIGSTAAVERRPELRGAVLATLTAAELHGGTGLSLTTSWEEVDRTAPGYPDSVISTWLQNRACAGRVASTLQTQAAIPDDLLRRFWTLVDIFNPEARETTERPLAEQLAASLCAALSVIVERCESASVRARLMPDRDAIERFAARLNEAVYPGDLPAFARTLAAEARRFEGDARPGGDFGLDDSVSNGVESQRWMDWRVPEPLGDHLRLRLWSRQPPPSHLRLQTNGRSAFVVKDSLKTIASIESERLLSLLLQLHLAHGPRVHFTIPLGPRPTREPTLADIQEADDRAYTPARQSTSRVHDAVPPLFVSLAMAYLAAGLVDRAQSLVSERLKAAEASRRDPATVRHAEIARLEIARRMRLPQPGIVDRIQQSSDASLITETLAVAVLAGPDSISSSPPPALGRGDYRLAHAWWSAQVALSDDAKRQLIGTAEQLFGHVRLQEEDETALPPEVTSAFRFDDQELRLLMMEMHDPRTSSRVEPLPLAHPAPGDTSLRSALREAALAATADASLGGPSPDEGKRRRAVIAFEEGELLALRLPSHGAALLRLAAGLYEEAHDPLGAWMSGIAAAIAFWHADRPDAAREMLDLTERAYLAMTKDPLYGALDLPAWNGPETERPPADDVPTGWTRRLTLYRGLAGYTTREEASLAYRPPDPSAPGHRLAELDPFPDLAPPEPQAAAPTRAAPASRERDWSALQLSLSGIGILLVWGYLASIGRLTPGPSSFINQGVPVLVWPVLLIAGVLFARFAWSIGLGGHGAVLIIPVILALPPLLFVTYWIVGWIARLILPWSVTPAWHFVFFVLLLVGIPVAWPLWRRLRRSIASVLAARGRLRVVISTVPGPGGRMDATDTPVTISISGDRLSLHSGWPPVITLNISSGSACPRPALQPYAESASSLSTEAREELRAFRTALGHRPLAVDLIVAPELASSPWEAVLSLSSLAGRIEDDPLHFRRAPVRHASAAARDAGSETNRKAVFIGDPAWLSMSQKAWGASGATVEPRGAVYRERVERPPAVVHIVGVPITTSRGVSISIGGSRSESPARQARAADPIPSFSLPEIVSADDRILRQAVAVLVQMEPVDSATRLATDREQAGYLRVFAAALGSGGAKLVITVPALPPGLAEAVLDALVPAVLQPGRQGLGAAVALARGRILGWPWRAQSEHGGRTEELKELAYDVCLFAASDEVAARSEGDDS